MNKVFIQRMLIMLTLLFGVMSVSSAADRFYMDAVNIEPGETKQLAFMLENSQEFYGFQAVIKLPAGLEFVQNNGKVDFKLSSRTDDSYSLVSHLLTNGSLQVGSFSTSHTAIKGNSGALLYTTVYASEDFKGGTLEMSDILFVNSLDNDVSLPDFTIELGTKHNDRFYIPDFKIAVGETKTISILLENETPFTAFQTDVYLPKGMSAVANSFKLTSRGNSDHRVSAKSFTDGRTRITCLSLSNAVFSDNKGALLNFDVTANKDISETSSIEMKNQIFSMDNAKEYVIPNAHTVVKTERSLVERITIDQPNVALKVGDTKVVKATVYPTFASTKDVEWTSNNKSVATVSQSGLITAVGVGTATIHVTAVDGSGVTATCEVTVSGIPVTDILLNRTSVILKATETVALSAIVSPTNASDKSLKWTSSDEAVARVDENGNVTALSVGNTVITATSVSNPEISAKCTIIVNPTPVSDIVLNKTSVSLQVGETFTFNTTVTPETATSKEVKWSSENPVIASIDDKGVVTSLSLGTTVIKATAADGSGVSASATVNVIPTLAEGIKIEKPVSSEFKVGETISLHATVLPENASDKSVVWSTSDKNIATVETSGIVTAVNIGTVIIKATNSAGVSDEISLTVVPTLAESISVQPTDMTLKVNETQKLIVNLFPLTTTDKNVVFESSDISVATVDQAGNVKAVSIGEATITVKTKDGSNISAKCNVHVVPTPAEKVEIKYDGSTTLQVGQTAQLATVIWPEDATDKSIEWQSQNLNILTVDTNGRVKAIGIGDAWISAKTANGLTAFITFKVVPTLVSAIELDRTSVSLKAGEKVTLSATISPENATDKSIAWLSSDKTVVSVNEEGVITGTAVGNADITASAKDGSGVSAICHVTVIPTPAQSIKIDQSDWVQMKAGETYQLTATVYPEDATDKTVKWSSDAPGSLAVDDNGLLHAYAVGDFIITATNSAGQSDRIRVKVNPTLAQSIHLNRSTAVLKVAGTLQLSVVFSPETTTNKNVVWKSSNPSIASVSDKGVVTAHALGDCVVTATTADGTNLSASCNVTVEEIAAESISITPKGPFNLKIGETIQLSASVFPETVTDKSVYWQSQSSAVKVDNNGLVTAVAPVENNWVMATNSSGNTDVVFVTVMPTLVSGLQVDNSSVSLEVGDSVKINVSVEPSDATDKSLVWTSDDHRIATVDKSGTIVAKSLGQTTIRVMAADGSGVSASITVSVIPTVATGIQIIAPPSTTLKVGNSLKLDAIVSPEDATDKSITWSSDNASIATVDIEGNVTAVGVGNVNIMAKNSSGQTATINIVVEPTLAESLIITNSNVQMRVGEQHQFEVIITPSTTTNKDLKWTSTNPDIVSIDNNGKATAHQLGNVMIEVATTDGSNLTATCSVQVQPVAVEQVVINYEGPLTLKVGDKVQLSATILPDNATDKSIEWVSQTDALSVDQNGLVTANSLVEQSWIGAFSPRSPYGDNPPTDYKYAIINFSVVKTLVERLEIIKDNDTMFEGDTQQLSVKVYPETATNQNVVWESSNPSVISVDDSGLLTAHQTGYSDIKVKATDGSGVYASIQIYVAVTSVESVIISANGSTELKDGETLQLTAHVYPETATDKSVRWETTYAERATVDQNGLVTAHSEIGDVYIWAHAGNVSAPIKLTVIETPAEQISIDAVGDTITIMDGEVASVRASVLPLTTTDKTVTWSCSDESILDIGSYIEGTCAFSGIVPGSANLIATTSNGISASIIVKVKPVLVESISIPGNLELAVGNSFEFKPEIEPGNPSSSELVWHSSDPSVGSMQGSTFYAHAQGETTITCSTTDGSNLSASCVIRVVKYASSITLSEHDVRLREGESLALTAEIQPIDATYKEVMWLSSDENVATVSENGLIEAKSEGSAIIEVYLLSNCRIADECKVQVDKASGIETISINDIKVRVVDHTLLIEDILKNTPISVFTLDGHIIYASKATSSAVRIDLDNSGIYIVKVGKYAVKIVIK